jgi:tRNA splicing endonuclease
MILISVHQQALYLTMHGQIAVYQNSSPSSAASTSCDSMDISDVTPTVVSTDDLYTIFFNKSPNFPLKYKVYEYFRDKGCCVHTAVNYGLDFAIYQTIPSLCHSALSVLVIDGVRHGEAEESLRWTHMSAMTRVMGVSILCDDIIFLNISYYGLIMLLNRMCRSYYYFVT